MKSFIQGFLAFSLIMSSFMVDQTPVQAEAFFNSDPVDKPTIRVSNYTKNPGCTTCWNVQEAADPGDIISFIIYYHNTSGEAARNVILRAAIPNQIARTHHITGSIIGQNAIESNGTATVLLSAGQRISLIHNSVRWYPNRSITPVALPNNQSGNDINDVGVGIGTIEPGSGTIGTLVFRAQVSNDTAGTPQPNPGNQIQPPFVTTDSATSISKNSATLRGRVSSQGTSAEAWFEYGRTTSLGNTTLRQFVGMGNDAAFTATPTGLQSNATYFYRAVAQNSAGITHGSIVSFTTAPGDPGHTNTPIPEPEPEPGSAPFVTTDNASSVDESFATLRGRVNPNDASTTAWFEYGTSFNLGNRTSNRFVGDGNNTVDFSQSVFGLQPNTTYFYRAVAQNQFGATRGSIRSFVTSGVIFTPNPQPTQQPPLPVVFTDSAVSVGQNFATLQGRVFSPESSAEAWFEYGQTPSLGNTTLRQFVGFGSNTGFSSTISGLFPGTTYYFRAVARNNAGTNWGNIMSFTTQGSFQTATPLPSTSPTVITNSASSVQENFAVLRGQVNPQGSQVTAWFEYGTSSGFLGTRAGTRTFNDGFGFFEFSQSVFGLQPNTTYFYRAVAQSNFGTSFGSIVSFTTSGQNIQPGADMPIAFTNDAVNITSSSARLIASINPRNSSTDAWFVYGTSPDFTSATARVTIGIGSSFVEFTRTISGLRSNTTYFYRIIARNQIGTSFGNILSFTTRRATTGIPTPTPTPSRPIDGADRPLVTLELSTDNEAPSAGDSFNVVVKYKNAGTTAARNANLTLNLPQELEFVRSTGNTQNANNNLMTPLGTIGAGSESALVIRLKVKDTLSEDTELIVNANLSYQDAQGNLQSVGSFISIAAKGTGEDETAAVGILSLFRNWLFYVIFFLFLIVALGIYAALARRIASLEERSTT